MKALMNFLLLLVTVFSISYSSVYSQTTTQTQVVDFATQNPNSMWGPNGTTFSMNMNKELFGIDENFDIPIGGIINIAGMQFGALVEASFGFMVNSKFIIEGFSLGEVDIRYPIDAKITYPQDYSYDQGDWVTIGSDYDLKSNAKITTRFPNAGKIKLDLNIGFEAELSAKLCAFGCLNFPIIDAELPTFTLNIFTLDVTGVKLLQFGQDSEHLYSYSTPALKTSNIPNFPLTKYGFEAELFLPNVQTSKYVTGPGNKILGARGSFEYIDINLNIFGLIAGLNIPYVSAAAKILDGNITYEFGPAKAVIDWTFLGLDLNFSNHIKQNFQFDPVIEITYKFPFSVSYREVLSNNSYGSVKYGSEIKFVNGKKYQYKYPCNFDEIKVTTTYTILDQNDNFLSHTYDSMHLKLVVTVLEFGLKVPKVLLFPGIPEVCVFGFCIGPIAAIYSPEIDVRIGPVWQTEVGTPLATYNWNEKNWNISNFNKNVSGPAFTMRAFKPVIALSKTDVSCHNDNTGSATVNLTTKSAAHPYKYVWSNGTVLNNSNASSHTINNVPAGGYQVTITDANSCTFYKGIEIDQPLYPLTLSTSKQDKKCNGPVNDGSINISASGGTSGYTYTWTGSGTVNGTPNQSNLDVGTYTVNVKDSKGCTASTSVVIEQPLPLGQNAVIDHVKCHADATGSVNVTAFGGMLPYNYTWSNNTQNALLNNVTAGAYTLTVKDANNCLSTQTYNVVQPSAPLNLTSVVTDVLCKGENTGAIDATTTGGTMPYNYIWYSELGGILPYQTEDISNRKAGVYTVRVTDANNCTFDLTSTVKEPVDHINSTPIITNINCYGDATGIIDPVVSGATPIYNYSWSNGSTGAVLQNVVAGDYELVLTDANNCQYTFNYNLTQPEAALDIVLIPTHVLCHGENTGKVKSIVTGGTTPYEYLWSNNVTLDSIVEVPTGNYELTVTDSKGCILKNNTDVNEPVAPLLATSIITDVDCYGNNTGAVDMTITGGTTPYVIQWNNESSFILDDVTPLITNLARNTYTADIKDAHNCKFTLVSVVNEPQAPLAMTNSIDDVNCYGISDGAIDITVTGGTAPYNYNWSNTATTEDLTAIPFGNYQVLVVDANNCVIVDSFYVPQPEAPLVATLSTVAVKCFGGNDGEIYSQVTGGTTPYILNWSNGVVDEEEQIGIPSDIYTLEVTDSKGCFTFTGMLVDQPAEPVVVVATVTDVQCYGGSDGIIDIAVTGGVEPYYYNWGNQNEILLNHMSEQITGLNVGTYYLRVKDRNNCMVEQNIQMGQPAAPVIEAIITNNLCFDDSTGQIDVTASGGTLPYSFLWSNGQTTEDAVNIVSGNHELVITDAQLCEYKKTFFVDQPTKLKYAYDIQELSCIDQADAAIIVGAYGGTAPYMYSWNNGVVGTENTDLVEGEYIVTITDNNGCIVTGAHVINGSFKECVYIPNTFTPNGDDYNDNWFIENLHLYPNAHVVVFNRWGNVLMESHGEYTPWDGKSNGGDMPSDVYYYIVRLNNDLKNEYKGTVTIVR